MYLKENMALLLILCGHFTSYTGRELQEVDFSNPWIIGNCCDFRGSPAMRCRIERALKRARILAGHKHGASSPLPDDYLEKFMCALQDICMEDSRGFYTGNVARIYYTAVRSFLAGYC